MTNKHLCIGAILLGAGVISSVGAIAAPIEIKTVFVANTDGSAGNLNDTVTAGDNSGLFFGSVNYDYYIGTYEVTNEQYVAFLNAVGVTPDNNDLGLYNGNMASGNGGIEWNGTDGKFQPRTDFANKPVNYVSFWSAARFCNWMTTNGTDTETGMYDLGGVKNPTNNASITRNDTAWLAGGVAIASENEWYKAAYYDPTKDNNAGGYYLYPMQSDTISTDDANYNNTSGGLTDVGYYAGKTSYYGTYDQGGNVWEWNDTVMGTTSQSRGVRGGSFDYFSDFALAASARSSSVPSGEYVNRGFRVASLGTIIPEPQTYALFGGIFLSGVIFLRRRKR